jgi:hypothetical protein
MSQRMIKVDVKKGSLQRQKSPHPFWHQIMPEYSAQRKNTALKSRKFLP